MSTVSKTFILTQYGKPHDWTQKFIDAVQPLEPFGWKWLIFTPNDFQSKGNVTVIPHAVEDFNKLCLDKLGIDPKVFITENGFPSVHPTDFCVFYGLIFHDHLKDSDYWGMCGWDTLIGRLDHFLPNDLWEADIFSDDTDSTINGTFCMFKNTENVNNLCLEIPSWKECLVQEPCKRCMGENVRHSLVGTDEYAMTEVCRKAANENRITFITPLGYPIHSHDRLIQHSQGVLLERKEDGTLIELFKDMNPPNWIHQRPFLGREIPYFHFMVGKKWPLDS